MAQFRLADAPVDHPQLPTQRVLLHIQSADAFAQLGMPDGVQWELARAAEHATPRDPFERADADYVRARIELALGRCEPAWQYANNSVRTWGPNDRRDSAPARITLATTHVIVGDSDAPKLVVAALDAVDGLRSARAYAMLAPLVKALSARKDSTSVELARGLCMAREGAR